MPLTGERTVPGIPHENYWFRRHEAAYDFTLRHARGQVLEVGCGEGYGSAVLASTADRVIGLDYDAATIAHAARTYPDTAFVRANLAALPLRSDTVDVVATLQVIEHVWNHPQFVRECHRVLAPGGVLLVTTPNRLTFSPGRATPINPFHTVEFTAAELAGLLVACDFKISGIAGLHAGARLAELDARHGGSFARAQIDVPPQRWSDDLAGAVTSVGKDDFVVLSEAERDVDLALDLIVLAQPIQRIQPAMLIADDSDSAGVVRRRSTDSASGKPTPSAAVATTKSRPDRSESASSALSTNTPDNPEH